MRPKYILFSACMLIVVALKANNIVLSNITVINNVTNTGKIIEFDLSWENSWRTASTGNRDGAWVFFKFKDNDGKWYPLNFTGTDNNMPAGVDYDMGNNSSLVGVGMFIFRSNLGAGNFAASNIRAGIHSYPGIFEVRGFAIEMVLIPQGSFWLGDGASHFAYQNSNIGNNPYLVTGTGASITAGTGAGMLYDPGDPGITGNLFTGFPTGYNAFWMMKYELSQGAYRDFLNTLTYTQQENRFPSFAPPTSPTGTNLSNVSVLISRHFIEIATPGSANNTPAIVGCDADADNVYNEPSDGEWITLTLLTWADVAAYLDWSGLRPMTEFEFEKACRGPLTSVSREFAWGDTTIANYPYTLINPGQASESISNSSSLFGNALSDSSRLDFLVRGGIFATAFSTRVSAGASYYGIMELSGHVSEKTITSFNVAGRSFNGKHGDGFLTVIGNANENYWPGVNGATGTAVSAGVYDGGDGVRSDGGTKDRGGHRLEIDHLRVSWRFGQGTGTTILTNASPRSPYFGIRGVRDAN